MRPKTVPKGYVRGAMYHMYILIAGWSIKTRIVFRLTQKKIQNKYQGHKLASTVVIKIRGHEVFRNEMPNGWVFSSQYTFRITILFLCSNPSHAWQGGQRPAVPLKRRNSFIKSALDLTQLKSKPTLWKSSFVLFSHLDTFEAIKLDSNLGIP